MFYCLIIISFSISISSNSSSIEYFKTVSFGLVFIGLISAVMLIMNGLLSKKRKTLINLEKVLIRLLISNNYSLMTMHLSAKSGMKIIPLEKFLKKRIRKNPQFSLSYGTNKDGTSFKMIKFIPLINRQNKR